MPAPRTRPLPSAILPYYVANPNIEATYAAITGKYAEFPSLCFVDTLDNIGGP